MASYPHVSPCLALKAAIFSPLPVCVSGRVGVAIIYVASPQSGTGVKRNQHRDKPLMLLFYSESQPDSTWRSPKVGEGGATMPDTWDQNTRNGAPPSAHLPR